MVESKDGTFKVGAKHFNSARTPKQNDKEPPAAFKGVDGTLVWIRFTNGAYFEACGFRSPKDNFSRKAGKRAATNRLLRQLKNVGHSEELRMEVLQMLAPELLAKPKKVFVRRTLLQKVLKAITGLQGQQAMPDFERWEIEEICKDLTKVLATKKA